MDLGIVVLDGSLREISREEMGTEQESNQEVKQLLQFDRGLNQIFGPSEKIILVKINEDPSNGPSYGGWIGRKIYSTEDGDSFLAHTSCQEIKGIAFLLRKK